MALYVNCKQRFLHDVLCVDTAMNDPAAAISAQQCSGPLQEQLIGTFIACNGGPHQPGKLGLLIAAHKRLLLMLR